MANKLKSIKDEVTPWQMDRKDRITNVIMTRLRIGHTRLTHCHLMEKPNGPPPTCIGCKVDLTVRHILVECPHVEPQRRTTIGTGTLKQILGPDAKIGKIIEFLKVTGIHNYI